MHLTLALLLLTLLVGASGSLSLRAAPAGVDHFFRGPGGLHLPPADGGAHSFAADDALMATFESTAGEGGAGEERLPFTPDVFVSPDHLRTYLSKLNAYYAIAGRPRFGKRSHAKQQATHKLLLRTTNQEARTPAIEDYYTQY